MLEIESDLVGQATLIKPLIRRRGMCIAISGTDGTGKSTLSRGLVSLFEQAGITTKYEHIHRWYQNLLWTPILILWNRFVSRELLIFDRCVYDNLVVFYDSPNLSFSVLTRFIHALYPSFDFRIFLTAPEEELLSRRSENTAARIARLANNYELVRKTAEFETVASGPEVLRDTLNRITARLPG